MTTQQTRVLVNDQGKVQFEQRFPATAFAAIDIDSGYERLANAGGAFRFSLAKQMPLSTATFDDTCGDLILINPVRKP